MKALCFVALFIVVLILVAGCDRNEEIVLSQGKLRGADVTVKIVRHARRCCEDHWRIEIYDASGDLKASFQDYFSLPTGFVQCEEGLIVLDGGKIPIHRAP